MDFETSAENIDKLPLRMWLRMLTCTTLIEREIRERLRTRFGMGLSQFDFMAQLYRCEGEGLTMGELSRRLMVTGGNVTGLTDRLSRDDLVERRPSPTDRRAQIVCLTEKGRQIFAEMAEVHENWIKEMFAGLSAEEESQLMDLLARTKESVIAAGEEEKEQSA